MTTDKQIVEKIKEVAIMYMYSEKQNAAAKLAAVSLVDELNFIHSYDDWEIVREVAATPNPALRLTPPASQTHIMNWENEQIMDVEELAQKYAKECRSFPAKEVFVYS